MNLNNNLKISKFKFLIQKIFFVEYCIIKLFNIIKYDIYKIILYILYYFKNITKNLKMKIFDIICKI